MAEARFQWIKEKKKKKLDSKYGVVFNNTDFIGKKRHDGN